MPIIPNVADMAHFNPVNFSDIVKSGIWGVIHKSRQGVAIPDAKYPSRMGAAKEAGLLWGAYDFATGDVVAANAAAFLSYSNLAAGDLAVLDFEDNTHSQMSGAQAYEWLDRVAQKRGRAPTIYGGNHIREQIKPDDPKWIDMAQKVPLWQCRYIKSQPMNNEQLFMAVPPIPPWTKNFLIQYTGDGVGPVPHTVTGLQNGADLNVFLGTRAALVAAWSGQEIAPAEPPQPAAPASFAQRAADFVKDNL